MSDNAGPRRHRIRDRRGRDRRDPLAVPGPLTPDGIPRTRTRRERFDATALRVVAEFQARWPSDLANVEFGVEDVPWVDDEWWPADVPLATLAPGTSRRPTRIVVYRLPVQARARRARMATEPDLVRAALAERVGELLNRPAAEVDPRTPNPADGAGHQP
jgi:hypothetical protein